MRSIYLKMRSEYKTIIFFSICSSKNLLIIYYSALQNFVDIIAVNSAYTVEIYYDSNKNFADLGWHHLDYVKAEIQMFPLRL